MKAHYLALLCTLLRVRIDAIVKNETVSLSTSAFFVTMGTFGIFYWSQALTQLNQRSLCNRMFQLILS